MYQSQGTYLQKPIGIAPKNKVVNLKGGKINKQQTNKQTSMKIIASYHLNILKSHAMLCIT